MDGPPEPLIVGASEALRLAISAMPYAINPVDGVRTYFEDSGGAGLPVLFYTGFADPLEVAKASRLAQALNGEVPPDLRRSPRPRRQRQAARRERLRATHASPGRGRGPRRARHR